MRLRQQTASHNLVLAWFRKGQDWIVGNNPHLAWVLLIVLFILLRLGNLLTAVEHVSWREELYRGVIAKEWIDGMKVPLWEYQADDYSGGSLVVGLLAVPFFLLMGPSLFALKLVPLCFSVAILLLACFFLRRHFGEFVAFTFGCLWTFSPPLFNQLSLVAMGFHTESTLFGIVMMVLFYEFLFSEKPKDRFLVCFGLVSGLAFWFTYITAITFLACVISWLFLAPKSLTPKRLLRVLGSVLLGLLPWILYNSAHSFAGLGILQQTFSGDPSLSCSLLQNISFLGYRLRELLFATIPQALFFESFFKTSAPTLGYVYYGIALYLVLVLVWRAAFMSGRGANSQGKLLPLFVYAVLYSLIYAASNLGLWGTHFIERRFLTPLFVSVISLMAISISQGKRNSLWFLGLIMLGLAGQSSLLFKEEVGRALHYKGYSYTQLGERWGHSFFRVPERLGGFRSVVIGREPGVRRALYRGVLLNFSRPGNSISSADVREWKLEIPPDQHTMMASGLGYSLSTQEPATGLDELVEIAEGSLTDVEKHHFYRTLMADAYLVYMAKAHLRWPSYLSSMDLVGPNYRKWFHMGLGYFLFWANECTEGWNGVRKYVRRMQPPDRNWVYRGLGRIKQDWLFNTGYSFNAALQGAVGMVPPNHLSAFYWGVGWEIRSAFFADRLRARHWIERLPLDVQSHAWKGFKSCERWNQLA